MIEFFHRIERDPYAGRLTVSKATARPLEMGTARDIGAAHVAALVGI